MDKNIIILILLNLMLISLTGLFSLNKIDLYLKQYFFWLIGFLLFFLGYFLNYRLIFEKHILISIIILSIIPLIYVLFLPGNIKSWFNLGEFAFQPSEFSKLGFFILLTKFLNYYQLELKRLSYLFFSLVTLLPYITLIFLQPDLGMTFFYFLIWFLVIINFISRREFIYFTLILIIIFLIMWFYLLKDYQKERILVFINPEADPLKTGYNLKQIRLSLSTSSFLGKGVGLGEIGRLGFLPSAGTDFILTFLIEERGILIFIIYSILIFLLINEITKAQFFHKNPQTKNFLFIISNYFLAKYSLTTLVNFSLFPIIGLPAPFISYGGSHLIFDLWLLGICFSLTKERI